jgi:hypothetical protein
MKTIKFPSDRLVAFAGPSFKHVAVENTAIYLISRRNRRISLRHPEKRFHDLVRQVFGTQTSLTMPVRTLAKKIEYLVGIYVASPLLFVRRVYGETALVLSHNTGTTAERSLIMPRGDKSKYTNKQKRQADAKSASAKKAARTRARKSSQRS